LNSDSVAWTSFWLFNFLCGLFLCGWPDEKADQSPVLRYVAPLTPKVYVELGNPLPSYFWYSIGTTQLVWSLFRIPILEKPFTSRLAQYCGDVSYSVYIVHYYILTALENRIANTAHYLAQGTDTQSKRIIAVIFEILILLPLVIWQADLFWRYVDQPTVKFARWFETICLSPT